MDPSGAIHTTALLERTRAQGKDSALLADTTVFLTHFNPAQTEHQKFFGGD